MQRVDGRISRVHAILDQQNVAELRIAARIDLLMFFLI
jgi:hypothetical protein